MRETFDSLDCGQLTCGVMYLEARNRTRGGEARSALVARDRSALVARDGFGALMRLAAVRTKFLPVARRRRILS